jgi:hypothetical protein
MALKSDRVDCMGSEGLLTQTLPNRHSSQTTILFSFLFFFLLGPREPP